MVKTLLPMATMVVPVLELVEVSINNWLRSGHGGADHDDSEVLSVTSRSDNSAKGRKYYRNRGENLRKNLVGQS